MGTGTGTVSFKITVLNAIPPFFSFPKKRETFIVVSTLDEIYISLMFYFLSYIPAIIVFMFKSNCGKKGWGVVMKHSSPAPSKTRFSVLVHENIVVFIVPKLEIKFEQFQ